MTLPPRKEWIKLPIDERLTLVGHRTFVGGEDAETWYRIGRHQYHWLVAQGLRPDHRFLDVACGSLRLGQYLIPYLNAGNYYGLEAEPSLVRDGLAHELDHGIAELKAPTFGHGYSFDFSFCPGFDVAIAQSLFTHLTLADIHLCFANLRPMADPKARFYFTFFEGETVRNPAGRSDANLAWRYPFEQIAAQGTSAGWAVEYIGDWGHLRGQMMAVARPSMNDP